MAEPRENAQNPLTVERPAIRVTPDVEQLDAEALLRSQAIVKQFSRESPHHASKETQPKQPAVTAKHPDQPRSIFLPHDAKDAAPVPRRVHEVELPNNSLNVTIVEDRKGEDKKPGLAMQITIGDAQKIFTLAADHPVVTDRQTGRTMLRVHNEQGKLVKYDPLAKQFIPDHLPEDIAIQSEALTKATPETYAAVVTDVAASRIDADSRKLNLESLDTSKLDFKDAGAIDDAIIRHDEFVILSIDPATTDHPEKLYVAPKSFVEIRRADNLEPQPMFVIENGVVTQFDPEKRHEVSVAPTLEEALAIREEAQNAPKTAVMQAQAIENIRELQQNTYETFNYHDPTLAQELANLGPPPARGPARQQQQQQQRWTNLYNRLTDAATNNANSEVDAYNEIAAALLAIDAEQRQLRTRGLPPEQYLINLSQFAREAQRRAAIAGGDVNRGDWLRGVRNDLRREAYYEQQSGSVPTPDFIGFSLSEQFALNRDVPINNMLQEFSRAVNSLTTLNQDLGQRRANEAELIRLEKAFATDPTLEIFIPQASVERGALPNGQPNPDVGRVTGPVILRRKENGQYVTVETFTHTNPDDENKLMLTQFAQLRARQERWLTDQLQFAFESYSEQEAQIYLGNISRSRISLISEDLRQRSNVVSTFELARRAFKNSADGGIASQGDNFKKAAPYLMQLPGVPEIMAEIERREMLNLGFEAHEDGTIRKMSDQELQRAQALLKTEDQRLNIMIQNDRAYEDYRRDLATLDDPQSEVSAQRLLAVEDPEDVDTRETYRKIRKSIQRFALQKYLEWKQAQMVQLNAELAAAQGDQGKINDIQAKINSLERQKLDATSMEVAEWIWRMTGRSGFFGAQSTQGENAFYEVTNFPRWSVDKQKSNSSENLVSRIGFGTDDVAEARRFLPGMAKEGMTEFLHTGFYDYFNNYAAFEPGLQVKNGLASKGLKKMLTPHDQAVVNGIFERLVGHKQTEIAPFDRNLTRDNQLLERAKYEDLSDEEKRALAKYHWAPVMNIGLENWRAMRDDPSIWGDWGDFGADFGKARKNNDTMSSFLGDCNTKKISEMQSNYWGRKSYRFKSEGSRRMLETIIEYRTKHNRSSENEPNWDARLTEEALETAEANGLLTSYERDALEDKFFRQRILIPNDIPIIRRFKKTPWEIKGPFFLIPGVRFYAVHHWRVTKYLRGLVEGLPSLFGDIFKASTRQP